ncbi:hypothetical protein EFN10_05040 [Propionibacterium freudenreichii]|nr:hypothetical protein [Propionibacterium freudenreichii]
MRASVMRKFKARFVWDGVAVAAVVGVSAAWVAGSVGPGTAQSRPVAAGMTAEQLLTLEPASNASGGDQSVDASGNGQAPVPRAGQDTPSSPAEGQVSAQVRHYFDVDPGTALPPDATISPDPSSWRKIDDKTAVMRVDVLTPGAAATPYAAVMAEQGGEWKVMGTLNVDETPTPTPTPEENAEPSAPASSPAKGAPASAAVPSPTP